MSVQLPVIMMVHDNKMKVNASSNQFPSQPNGSSQELPGVHILL